MTAWYSRCKQEIREFLFIINILIFIIVMEKKFYVAPSVELIEVAVEAGFAASGMTEPPTEW